jgi:hypothetical protein
MNLSVEREAVLAASCHQLQAGSLCSPESKIRHLGD